MTKIFSINEVISFSWNKAKKHVWFFVRTFLMLFAISVLPQIIILFAIDNFYWGIAYVIVFVIIQILSIVVAINFIKTGLDIVYERNDKPCVKSLFKIDMTLFIRYYVVQILYSIVLMVPLIIVFSLFSLAIIFAWGNIVKIILGVLGIISLIFMIIYSVRLGYHQYFIVEGSKIIESLKNSYKITKGLVWSLIVVGFVFMMINVLGFLCLIVGLFITIPMMYLGSLYIYKKLKETDSGAITSIQEVKPQI